MFPFSLFKKKKKFEDISQEQELSQPTFQQSQFNERQDNSDDLINSKLDTINAKLDNIELRLRKIEELASQ